MLIVLRVGIAWVRIVFRLKYYGASFLRTLYMNKPMLYWSCLCRLIIFISFHSWSIVRVVSVNINFTALLCRKFKLFYFFFWHRYIPPHERQKIQNRSNVGIFVFYYFLLTSVILSNNQPKNSTAEYTQSVIMNELVDTSCAWNL